MQDTGQGVASRALMRLVPGAALAMALAMPLGATGYAAAQDHRNGATWYGRAIGQVERFSSEELTQLRDYALSQGGSPSPEIRALLLRAGPLLEQFTRGANQPYADFQLDRSEGFFMPLPHLGSLRQVASIARADALARLHDGDTTGAADRIAALYRVGNHVATDQVAISSLVGQAIFKFGDDAATLAFDRAAFGVDESDRLLRAIDTLDQDDPFNMLGAMVGEQELAINWLGQGTPEQQMVAMESLLGESPAVNDRAQALLAMSPEEYQAQVAQFDGMMDRVIDAFSLSDPHAATAAMNTLEEELVAGEHGLLSLVLAPAYGKLLERKHEAQALVRERRESLEALLGGAVKPLEVANAAVWYLRAIDALDMLAEERSIVLHELAIDSKTDVPEATLAFLDAAQPIIDELHEGSLKQRCSFGRTAGIDRAMFLPPYAPGLRNVFRLLRAESIRRVRAGEIETAIDLFGLAYRIIGHVGDDPQMLSAIVSHRAYADLQELLVDADRAGLLDDDRRLLLRSSFERIDRGDPFGYLAARRAAADQLVAAMRSLHHIHGQHRRGDAAGEASEPNVPTSDELRQLGDDDLLATLAAVDGVFRLWESRYDARSHEQSAAAVSPESAPADATLVELPAASSSLSDVLSLEAWRLIAQRVPAAFDAVARGAIAEVVQKGAPTLNLLADRRAQARQDLRAGAVLLDTRR